MSIQAVFCLIVAILIVITGIIMAIKYHFDAKANDTSDTEDKNTNDSLAVDEEITTQDNDILSDIEATRLSKSSRPPED